MTLRDDVRWVRDALDSTLHGALPNWPREWTTKEGEDLARLVTKLRRRWIAAEMARGDAHVLRVAVAAERATNERLTVEIEALRARMEERR